MGIEIEKKFLVNKKKWNKPDNGCLYTQAYLAKEGCTLRVRIAETKAFITIKVRKKFASQLLILALST